VTHVIEPAASGRARCRGCGRPIAKGELRLGERVPNPFADDKDMTLWFHLRCAAYKRPQTTLETLAATGLSVEDAPRLAEEARKGVEHRRLPRVDGAERSPNARAGCRSCREKIAKESWRIRLVFFEDGRFTPSGYVHAGCAAEYLGTADVVERLEWFGGPMDEGERADLTRALAGAGG